MGIKDIVEILVYGLVVAVGHWLDGEPPPLPPNPDAGQIAAHRAEARPKFAVILPFLVAFLYSLHPSRTAQTPKADSKPEESKPEESKPKSDGNDDSSTPGTPGSAPAPVIAPTSSDDLSSTDESKGVDNKRNPFKSLTFTPKMGLLFNQAIAFLLRFIVVFGPVIFVVFLALVLFCEPAFADTGPSALISGTDAETHLFFRHCARTDLMRCTDWALTETIEGAFPGTPFPNQTTFIANTLPVNVYPGTDPVPTPHSSLLQFCGRLYLFDIVNGPWPGFSGYKPGTTSAYVYNLVDYSLGRPRTFQQFAELCGFALSAFCGYQALAAYLNQ